MFGLDEKKLGLDIGSCSIKWIVYSGGCKKPVIHGWGKIKTPPGTIRDGKVIDRKSLSDCLGGVLARGGVKISKGSITLSCPEMIVRIFDLPKMRPAEMDSAVSYEMEQYTPLNSEEYITDYRIVGEAEEGGARLARILLAAIPARIAEGYIQLLEDIKIKPAAVDFNGNSAARFLPRFKRLKGDDGCVVLDIGACCTSVSIFRNGIPLFARVIQNGGREILRTSSNSFSFPLEDEVYRSVQFYRAKNDSNVSSLALIGGGSFREGLGEYLSSHLNLEYLKLDGELPLSFRGKFDCSQLPLYVNVFGLPYREDS